MEVSKVSFSPGEDCMNDIIEQIQSASKFLDVCVFTISDNRISDELITAYNNGIEIRIISDNEKMNGIYICRHIHIPGAQYIAVYLNNIQLQIIHLNLT